MNRTITPNEIASATDDRAAVRQSGFPVLDNDLLRTFVAIVETGSFRSAAKVVFRTPSAVSMQIKKLEEGLNRSLLDRDSQTVKLTPDGEALLGYARRMLALSDEALCYFRKPAVEGTVSFGAPDDYGTRFLPNILCRFAATHPAVDVEVMLDGSKTLLDRLNAGSLDMVLLTVSPDLDLNGDSEIVHSEPLVWMGLRGGMAWEKDPLPLALADYNCAWRIMALERLNKAGIRYRTAYTSHSGAGQIAAVQADLAIAPFPESLVAAPFRALGPREGLPELGKYHVALCRRSDPGSAASALASHVLESFRESGSS